MVAKAPYLVNQRPAQNRLRTQGQRTMPKAVKTPTATLLCGSGFLLESAVARVNR